MATPVLLPLLAILLRVFSTLPLSSAVVRVSLRARQRRQALHAATAAATPAGAGAGAAHRCSRRL